MTTAGCVMLELEDSLVKQGFVVYLVSMVRVKQRLVECCQQQKKLDLRNLVVQDCLMISSGQADPFSLLYYAACILLASS
jgi:hypothetical protein